MGFCELRAEDFAGKKANFHSHTTRCGHAVGSDREYVEAAIAAGFQVLGFSDHGPQLWAEDYVSGIRMKPEELESYVESVLSLKKEYAGQIELYVGLEVENINGIFEKTLNFYRDYPIDYLILGQHFFGPERKLPPVTRPREDPAYLDWYVRDVLEALETDCFLYVAHPDILNFQGDKRLWRQGMEELLDAMKQRNMPVEINGNGFREHLHYPNPEFMQLAASNGNAFLVGVDAHDPKNLLDAAAYDGCVALAEGVGGRVICTGK